jgi:hypothetical protein
MICSHRTDLLRQTKIEFLNWVGPLGLSTDEVIRVPKGVQGVYMLHVLAHSYGGYATFYVGKTMDVRRRLFQHLGERTTKLSIRAAREIDAAYWSAAPVEDAALLGAVESGLIRILRPICNTQIPASRPVLVNLPPLSLLDVFYEEK